MSEILNEPSVEVTETVEAVEPSAENNGVQKDVWAEDFDTSELPSEETVEAVEPNEETVANEQPEYITSGLGDLAEPIVVKVNGKIYDIKDKDQIRDLMERGFNATQKLQELADMKRELNKERNPELSEQDLNTMDTDDEVERMAQEMLASPKAEEFKNVFSSMPEDVLNKFRSNPQMLQGLRVDIESGFVGHIMPTVERYMNVDGLGFDEAYMRAGKEFNEGNSNRQAKADKLASASSIGSVMDSKPKDIWNMSDDEYSALQDTVRQ